MKQEIFVLHEEKMREASCEILIREDLSHDQVWWHHMCNVGYIAAFFLNFLES
jgi:hypothetical protein